MLRLFLLSQLLLLSSCSLPDTPLWNERRTAKSVRMPMETATKVLLWGNLTSAIRNPVTSSRKRFWMLKNRSEIAAKMINCPKVDHLYRQAHSIEDLLDKMKMPPRVAGNVEYLIDGKSFFTALHQSVADAKEKIDTRVFIFDNDDVAVAYSDHLKRRSREVKCRVLMDELGSLTSWWTDADSKLPKGFKPPSSMAHYLEKKSKVRARESKNPGLVADHTKLIIFDEKVAYLGGMNIGREYRYDWHDMMMRVTGPTVKILQNEFNKAWRLQGGLGDWAYPFKFYPRYRKTIKANELGIRILKTAPGKRQIAESILAAIRMSKKRVYIQNSYFTSDALEAELIAAQKRGVDVHFIFPKKNDSKLLAQSNEHFAKNLIKAKAKVYGYPKFSHVKAIVVDDWVCVGSANFDALSLRINNELNIAFTDKKSANKLVNDLFKKDIRQSQRLYSIKPSGRDQSWLTDQL